MSERSKIQWLLQDEWYVQVCQVQTEISMIPDEQVGV